MPERPYMQSNKYKETEYPVWNLMKEMYGKCELTPAQAKFCTPIKPAEELYDVVANPDEINNLTYLPKYKNILEKRRGILEDWIKKTGDKTQVQESPQSISQ